MIKSTKTIEAIMKSGSSTEFWKLICSEIDNDIIKLQREFDSDEIANMPAVEYKLAMENLKDKIKHLRDLKNKPQIIIQNLYNNEEEEEDIEHY